MFYVFADFPVTSNILQYNVKAQNFKYEYLIMCVIQDRKKYIPDLIVQMRQT